MTTGRPITKKKNTLTEEEVELDHGKNSQKSGQVIA